MMRALLALAVLCSGCGIPSAECTSAAPDRCGATATQPAGPPDAGVGSTIMLVGDSITAQWAAGHWPAGTVNAGIGGNWACNAEHPSQPAPLIVAQAGWYVPSVIYIMLGVNDNGDAAHIWACLQADVELLRAWYPGVHVRILSNIPLGAASAQCAVLNAKLATLRGLIASGPYDYLDTATVMTCGETCGGLPALCSTYTTDGVHLIAAGYTAWAAALGLP